MQGKQPYDAPRVHMRALARLQQLHEEISSGRCPSLQNLAVCTDRTSRTIKRDIKALRQDFKAPLVYDRQRKGFRYAEPGWQLPPSRFSQWSGQKSGGDSAVSSEFLIAGMIFHPSRVKS